MLPVYVFETVIEEVWSQFSNCITTFKEEPMLLLPFGVGFASAIIELTKDFFSFKH